MGKRKQGEGKQPRTDADHPAGRRLRITARRCEGTDDLAALDRMRRELFDADATRWSKGRRKKGDLVAAFGYWMGYPMFLEMIGHGWRSDSMRPRPIMP